MQALLSILCKLLLAALELMLIMCDIFCASQQEAIRLKPNFADAHLNQGNVLKVCVLFVSHSFH